MNIIKENKLSIFMTMMYVLTFIFVKEPIITLDYFVIVFILELVYLLREKYHKIFFQSIMLIPLIGILTYKNIPLINLYNTIFIIYILFIKKSVKLNSKVLFVFILFVVVDLLRVLIINNDTLSSNFISVPFLYMSILYGILLYNSINNYDELKFYSGAFIIGLLLSVFYGFICRYIEGGLKYAIINDYIFTRNIGAAGDPNYFALYICLTIAMLLVYIICEKKNIIKSVFVIFGLVILGLSTSSRMYYILILFLFLLFLFVIFKELFTKRFYKWVFIVIIMIITGLMFKNIIISNVDYLVSRLGDTDVSNGRFGLVSSYVQYMNSNVFIDLFGVGIPFYNVRCGIVGYAHNLYIELFVCNGLIGLLFIIIGLLKFIVSNLKLKNIYFFFPLFTILIASFALNFIEVDSFYLLFGLIFSYVRIGHEKIENKVIKWEKA